MVSQGMCAPEARKRAFADGKTIFRSDCQGRLTDADGPDRNGPRVTLTPGPRPRSAPRRKRYGTGQAAFVGVIPAGPVWACRNHSSALATTATSPMAAVR